MKARLAPFLVLIEARYAPLLFAVSPQAYAVYLWLFPHQYTATGEFFAILGGIGYEAIYVGAIAWAEEGRWSFWTWATATCALLFSMVVAYYVYRDEGWWSWLHSGFPLVAFTYTMNMHVMQSPKGKAVAIVNPPVSQPQHPDNENLHSIDKPSTHVVHPQRSLAGYVYILRSSDNCYKIGRAQDVQNRMRNIAGSVPFKVELVHAIKTSNMVRLEIGFHRAYEAAGKRLNGEWFRLNDEDVAFLQSLGDMIDQDAIENAIEIASVLAGPPPASYTKADPLTDKKTLAVQMRKERKPWREIADTVGMAPSTVRAWVRNSAKNGVHDEVSG